MFLVELTYKVSLTEVDRLLQQHADYLNSQYEQGNLIFSGRKTPRTGGLILTRFTGREAVDAFIHHDPFYREHIADYRVVEFIPGRWDDAFTPFIQP
jgi:uncharacterized protein YciI